MKSIFLYACLLACLYSVVNMFVLPQTPNSANESSFTAIKAGQPQTDTVHTHIHTRNTIIIKIINRHWSEMVSKESHLPINYDHKLAAK